MIAVLDIDFFASIDEVQRQDAIVQRMTIVCQRIPQFQIAGMLRRTVMSQIGRGCAGYPFKLEQPAGNQAGVGQRTAADHAVGAVVDQVDESIAHAQINLYLRIAGNKVRQRRQQQLASGGTANVDAQHALRRTLRLGHAAFHLLQLCQPFNRSLVVTFAFGRYRHAAGGTLEQLGLQVIFQALDQLGDGGFGHPQRVRGTGEAAGFHHAVKHPDSE
ncbi:hypothetical protein D3C72_1074190 [compost metagenome]